MRATANIDRGRCQISAQFAVRDVSACGEQHNDFSTDLLVKPPNIVCNATQNGTLNTHQAA